MPEETIPIKHPAGTVGKLLTADESETNMFADSTTENKGFELSEKRLKQILGGYLLSLGWILQIQWESKHGIDIEAKRGSQRWVIQVKSSSNPTTKPNIVFASVLGEIVQRIDDTGSQYSIALPDCIPFYRLWRRLPQTAKHRIGLSALFVNSSGEVKELF
jgi:hypothetical protein